MDESGAGGSANLFRGHPIDQLGSALATIATERTYETLEILSVGTLITTRDR